ncbi:MAG: ABC transporter permease [Agriterribacter sp.]
MKHNPPKWSLRFLRWFCRQDFLEEIEGNLTEIYIRQHQQSHSKAARQFTWNVIKHLKPEFIKPIPFPLHYNYRSMFKNHFKSGYRNLKKSKGFTALNIIGLSVGLATFLLIALYVADEWSYDTFNLKANRIYRITENAKLNGNEGSYAGTEKPLMNALKDFSGIEKMVRIIPRETLFKTSQKFNIKKEDINIEEKRVAFAESALFDVFTLPMIEGTPATSLNEPHSAVITESMAKKYFHDIHTVGKTITINDSNVYKVTGVIKDIPSQSHFNYDFILSYNSIPEYQDGGWGYAGIHQYVLLKPNTDIHQLEKTMQEIAISNYPPSMTQGGNYLNYELTPLLNIHLRSHSLYELSKSGNIQYVYIFSAIAFFILLIACVNFMNLSTARSSGRAKDVSMRKVLGSGRGSLIAQFLTESIILTFIATVLAIILAALTLPLFNEVAARNLSINVSSLKWLLPFLVFGTLIIGILAGLYPAFILSSFKPLSVLKGKMSTNFKAGYLRSFLVVFQFSISIFLIIGTIVIYRQLNYIQHKNVGFDRSQVLVIKNVNQLGSKAKILRQQLKQVPGITNVTMSSFTPTGEERNITGMFPELPLDIKQDVLSDFWPVDEDYLATMGIQLIAGRNFSADMPTDSSGLIVNEAFVKRFGFKDPLNKPIYRNSIGLQQFHIIGVMKDFNYSSLKDEVKPVALNLDENTGAISVRLKAANIPAVMEAIEDKWSGLSRQPFTYSFMDQEFDATYRSEQRTGQLFISFSTIAILIACLGLFGLSAYAAERRIKEIGIRKVLGAKVSGIVAMLSVDFIKLVIISILIASPVAWWAMNKWLQDFAYRSTMEWWVIGFAGIIAVLIAFTTISFQSVKAALSNPTKSLKAEG